MKQGFTNYLKRFGLSWGIFVIFLFSSQLSYAGGAFSTTPNGIPVEWQDGEAFYRLDIDDEDGANEGGGSCSLAPQTKSATINGFDVSAMIEHAFSQWSSQTTGLDITRGPDLDEDVTLANFENYYVGSSAIGAGGNVTADACYNGDTENCINPILFDNNGLITDGVLGECARFGVFAFVAILPLTDGTGTIVDSNLKAAQGVISGACVAPGSAPDPNCFGSGYGDSCPIVLDQAGLQGVMTHEMGHFLGLDHTLADKDTYLACSSVGDDCSEDQLEQIPTMIGLAVPGADLDTLTQDDIAAIRSLYPDSNSTTCSITGTVQTASGGNGRCIEVVATQVGNPDFVISTVSGAYVPRYSQGFSCQSAPQNATTYGQCVDDPQADQLKVHTNCSLPQNQCGQFEMAGVPEGQYNITLRTFKAANSGSAVSIPFVLEPCDQVRNEIDVDDNLSAVNNVVVNCPAGADVGIIETN